jgi:hypothetical protein
MLRPISLVALVHRVFLKVVKSANSFKAAGFAFFNKSLENVFTFSGLSFFLQAQVGMSSVS